MSVRVSTQKFWVSVYTRCGFRRLIFEICLEFFCACIYVSTNIATSSVFMALESSAKFHDFFFAITRDVMLLVTISLVENFNKVHWLINLNILPINYFFVQFHDIFHDLFGSIYGAQMAGKFQIWTYLLNLVEDLCLIFGNVAVLKYVSWMSSRNFFTHKCFASIEFA